MLMLMLMEKEYPKSMVENALRKAKAKRPIFATLYDPRILNLPKLQLKHWRSTTQDPYLNKVFLEPPWYIKDFPLVY